MAGKIISLLVAVSFLVAICASDAINPACICLAEYRPVCGQDGQTYSNSCRATCQGTKVAYNGVCRLLPPRPTSLIQPNCFCPMLVVMVTCGSDGKEYGNPCFATCAGVGYTMGHCSPKQ